MELSKKPVCLDRLILWSCKARYAEEIIEVQERQIAEMKRRLYKLENQD